MLELFKRTLIQIVCVFCSDIDLTLRSLHHVGVGSVANFEGTCHFHIQGQSECWRVIHCTLFDPEGGGTIYQRNIGNTAYTYMVQRPKSGIVIKNESSWKPKITVPFCIGCYESRSSHLFQERNDTNITPGQLSFSLFWSFMYLEKKRSFFMPVYLDFAHHLRFVISKSQSFWNGRLFLLFFRWRGYK